MSAPQRAEQPHNDAIDTPRASGSAPAKLGAATRFAYGLGGIATSVKDAAVVNFLLIFYTQVVGLPGVWYGVAAGVGQIVDAVVDPAIGTWSDNTRTRFGRRHPFMLGAALPYAIAFVLLFNPPRDLPPGALFCWAAGFMVASRVLLSLFAIPHAALGAELSTDYDERTSIASDRTVLAWVGGILLPAFAYLSIFVSRAGTDGRLIASHYSRYAVVSAGVILLVTLASSLGTWGRIASLPAPHVRRSLRFLDPFRDVGFALRNANFRRVFVALFLAGGVTGVATSFAALSWLVFWQFTPNQTAALTFFALVPTLFAAVAVAPLSRRFEKQRLYLGTLGVVILNALWFTGGRLLGLLPENGTPLILVLALVSQFAAVTALVLNGSVWASIIADIADEYEVEHGERKDGVFFAALSFGTKVPLGLGNMLGGLLLGWVGIVKGMTPGSVPADVLFRLGLVAGPFVAAALVLPLVAMARYDITRARHAELRGVIEGRRAAP